MNLNYFSFDNAISFILAFEKCPEIAQHNVIGVWWEKKKKNIFWNEKLGWTDKGVCFFIRWIGLL